MYRQVTLPSTPPPLSVTLGRGFLPLPLCGACPFVGYCGLFSINYFRKKNTRHAASCLFQFLYFNYRS